MPNDVEKHVRLKLRHSRWKQAMTPEELSGKTGFTVSKIKQLESGKHTIFVSDLCEIAMALGVPVAEFFEGLEGQAESDRNLHAAVPVENDAMPLVQLVRMYFDLDVTRRKQIMDLAQTLRQSARRAAC